MAVVPKIKAVSNLFICLAELFFSWQTANPTRSACSGAPRHCVGSVGTVGSVAAPPLGVRVQLVSPQRTRVSLVMQSLLRRFIGSDRTWGTQAGQAGGRTPNSPRQKL